MSKSDILEMEGVVTNVLPGSKFDVVLDDNGMKLFCTISGKLHLNKIKIIKGDKVTVAISPYDLTKGRIVWRHK